MRDFISEEEKETKGKVVSTGKNNIKINPSSEELKERTMGAREKAREASLKQKYDPSGMKASMVDKYGKEKGKQVYFATIRKKAMSKNDNLQDQFAGNYEGPLYAPHPDLLVKEETPVEKIDRIAREKVAARSKESADKKAAREQSASAFQAHKKEVLAKGGRPVDALDSWQKKKMQDSKESYVPGKPAEKLGAVTAIPKDERDAAKARILAKAKAAREKGMKEEVEQIDEISDKRVQRVVDARNRRFDRSMDSGAPQKEFHQARRSNKLAARRNQRTGSNVKVDPDFASEEFEIEEGMTMKDFKANRKKIQRKEASADAKKRGHVGKEWYNSGRTYSPDEAKRGRANMQDHERQTRHRSAVDPDSENDDLYSADKTKNPKKLRKQKAMGESLSFSDFMEARRMDREGVDRGDARREQRAAKAKASLAAAQKGKATREKAGITHLKHKAEKEHETNYPGSRQAPKVKGAKETPAETHSRRVNRQVARVVKHGHTSKEKKEVESMSKHTSRFD